MQVQELYSKYLELKTLEKTAEYFQISLEKLRQLFIQHNLTYKKRNIYTCNHNFFSEDNEKSFYWAGFLAADGNIAYKRNRISLTLKLDDLTHIEKFKSQIEADCPIVTGTKQESRPEFKKNEYHFAKIRVSSAQMVKDLLKFGITINKSRTYQIPAIIPQSPCFKHFIRGVIDGDGSVFYFPPENSLQARGHVSLCGTQNCVQTVLDYINNLLDSQYTITHIDNTLYVFHIRKTLHVQKILHHLYDESTISLDRKYKNAQSVMNINYIPPKIEVNKEQLQELVTQKFSLEEISKKLNLTRITIGRRLREFDIKYDTRPILLQKYTPEQLIEEYKQIRSLKDMAKKLNVCGVTVKNAFATINFNYKDYRLGLTKEMLLESYSKTLSTRKTALELGFDRTTIVRYLKRYKIKRENLIASHEKLSENLASS